MIQRKACLRRRVAADRCSAHYRARVTRLGPLAIAAGVPFGAVLLTGAVNGGYFPSEWGWPALALVLVCVLAVLLRERIVLTRLEWLALGALAAFDLWTLFSILWATSATEPVLSAERTLVYVLFLAALLLVTSRTTAPAVLVGVLAAAVGLCGYALVERLWPGRLEAFPPPEGFQLAGSIGYWNGLGILATMGILLAVGIAAHAHRRSVRIAVALSLLVTAPTLYFTFSRGALLALGVGGAAMALLDPRRARLGATALAAAVAPAVAIWLASRSEALTASPCALPTPARGFVRRGHARANRSGAAPRARPVDQARSGHRAARACPGRPGRRGRTLRRPGRPAPQGGRCLCRAAALERGSQQPAAQHLRQRP
jgi:hypothetical protein